MTTAVRVRTPCRLHFGMFGFGNPDDKQFGGIGTMVEPPGVAVEFLPSNEFAVRGVLAGRARAVIDLLVGRWHVASLPACEVSVHSPPDHIGLGVGTQLGLALAAGLRRFVGLSDLTVEELSSAVQRGQRSAVGTYGFERGGLILDGGKRSGQPLGELGARVELPDSWRFVLFCNSNDRGLAGTNEVAAFERLPSVPANVTRELWSITNDEILPAAKNGNCQAFGDAVYRFGRLAGGCFAEIQGGPFANEETRRLVESIRGFGVPGAGQSSWGPTVFAIVDDETQAHRLAEKIASSSLGVDYDVVIARPNNCGATIES